jgi:hypothetical protein
MSKILKMPDSIYDALVKAADSDGQTPADWIAKRLSQEGKRKETAKKKATKPKTMADFFDGYIGGFASDGKVQMSVDCGLKFAEGMAQKRRDGHL